MHCHCFITCYWILHSASLLNCFRYAPYWDHEVAFLRELYLMHSIFSTYVLRYDKLSCIHFSGPDLTNNTYRKASMLYLFHWGSHHSSWQYVLFYIDINASNVVAVDCFTPTTISLSHEIIIKYAVAPEPTYAVTTAFGIYCKSRTNTYTGGPLCSWPVVIEISTRPLGHGRCSNCQQMRSQIYHQGSFTNIHKLQTSNNPSIDN